MKLFRLIFLSVSAASIVAEVVSAQELDGVDSLYAEEAVVETTEQLNSPASAQAVEWISLTQSELVPLAYPKQLAQVYEHNEFLPIWTDNDARIELETQINVISLAGISPEFEWRALQLQGLKQESEWERYDVFATDSLFALMSYIESIPEFGKSWFFGTDHNSPLPAPTLWADVKPVIKENALNRYVRNLRPDAEQYSALVKAIIALQQQSDQYWPYVDHPKLLKPGKPLPDGIKPALINNLTRQGMLFATNAETMQPISDDNQYDEELVRAVKRFQHKHGLKVDGIIGRNTREWLNKTPNDRIQILALNMERLRLWPNDRQHTILVNIPDYEMKFWFQNKLVFDSKVVVGRTSRRTPLFTSNLDSIVLNPSWNVPVKIMRKDILPKQRVDNEYLAKHRYTVLNGWQTREVVDPLDIDWATVNPNNFPYRLQQAPGAGNALGRFKFNTPNNNAIYLHDTPAKGLFNRPQRAFSSGCIRVQHADKLAALLFDLSGMNMDDYQYYLRVPETKWVTLRRRIDVHTIYQTAWVNDEGEVEYRDDVYYYDTRPKRSVSLEQPVYFTSNH